MVSQGEPEPRGACPRTNDALAETEVVEPRSGFGGNIGEHPSPRVRSATLGSDVERLRRIDRFPERETHPSLELCGTCPRTNDALAETEVVEPRSGFGGNIGEHPSPRVRSATLGSDVERLRRIDRFPEREAHPSEGREAHLGSR